MTKMIENLCNLQLRKRVKKKAVKKKIKRKMMKTKKTVMQITKVKIRVKITQESQILKNSIYLKENLKSI